MRWMLVVAVPALLAAGGKPSTSTVNACEAKKSALLKKEQKGECVEFSKGAQKLNCDTQENCDAVMAFGKQCKEEDAARLAAANEKYEASKKKMGDAKAELDAKLAATPAPAATKEVAPGALAKNACQAELEDGTVLFSAEAEKYTDCSKQIEEQVRKAKCTEGVKKFPYLFRRGDMKPSTRTLYCK